VQPRHMLRSTPELKIFYTAAWPCTEETISICYHAALHIYQNKNRPLDPT
jgi:hypothetical protein